LHNLENRAASVARQLSFIRFCNVFWLGYEEENDCESDIAGY